MNNYFSVLFFLIFFTFRTSFFIILTYSLTNIKLCFFFRFSYDFIVVFMINFFFLSLECCCFKEAHLLE